MDNVSVSAQERIKLAARQVFIEKGYDRTTSRDIAQAAGINLALTNYYFRSKEKLFKLIFEEMYQTHFAAMRQHLNQELPTLQQHIEQVIDAEFASMQQSPGVAAFLIHEMHRNPTLFTPGQLPTVDDTVFGRLVTQAVAKAMIPPLGPLDILLLIISNIHYLFASKTMFMISNQLSEVDFDAFAQRHKQVIKDMIISYLFAKKGSDY